MDTRFFTPDGTAPEPYFLVVSALVPYKRLDVAIQAADRLGVPLKVVGSGPDLDRLRRTAGPSVEFLGALGPTDLLTLYRRATALVLPAEEDFGIAPVEAMACGRPVVALGRGGATETVVAGETGWLVGTQTDRAFADAMDVARHTALDPLRIAAQAERFSVDRFETGFGRLVASVAGAPAC